MMREKVTENFIIIVLISSKKEKTRNIMWDGSFSESKYRETGNMVNDVIENDGRIVHEATVDGYTHEVVDRGEYFSDDYYFPQKEKGKKSHIHYEIRSNGEYLINGKKISVNKNRGETKMRHAREVNRNHNLEGTILSRELDDLSYEADKRVQAGSKIIELGEKFEEDKNRIEDKIETIKTSKLSADEKRRLIEQLEEVIISIQDQYDKAVSVEEFRVRMELEGQIVGMEERIEELQKQEDSLRELQMEVSVTDTMAAANVAENERREIEGMKREYVQKLNAQIEKSEIQRRNIMNFRRHGE